MPLKLKAEAVTKRSVGSVASKEPKSDVSKEAKRPVLKQPPAAAASVQSHSAFSVLAPTPAQRRELLRQNRGDEIAIGNLQQQRAFAGITYTVPKGAPSALQCTCTIAYTPENRHENLQNASKT